MNIKFSGLLVNECKLTFEGDNIPDPSKLKFNFKFYAAFLPDEPKKFAIAFDFNLKSDDGLFKLNIKTISPFETDSEITEGFKESNFPKINAPAIVFPYIRTYVSNLMLNSGFHPINLPSINFVKIVENTDNKIKSDSKINSLKKTKSKKVK